MNFKPWNKIARNADSFFCMHADKARRILWNSMWVQKKMQLLWWFKETYYCQASFLRDLECCFIYNVDKSEQEDETCLLHTMAPLFLLWLAFAFKLICIQSLVCENSTFPLLCQALQRKHYRLNCLIPICIICQSDRLQN